jgi:type IV pilus assembly protein PilA
MKKRNQKGFTLAELLIVVAIIAVLVAIAIPIFTKRLEQSRETTDIANLRSAYAAAQTAAMAGDENGDSVSDTIYYYDPNNEVGINKASTKAPTLGKGTKMNGSADYSALPDIIASYYSNTSDNRSKRIAILFDSGSVEAVSFK